MEGTTGTGRPDGRRRFLGALYERTDADVNAYEDGYEIAGALGIDPREAERFVRYLEERGLVQNVSQAGLTVRITALGIDAVEGGP
jgi:uncharacterized protein YueI